MRAPLLLLQTLPAPEPAEPVTTAATDTSGGPLGVAQLGRDVGEAGNLLIQGQWDLFWARMYEGLAGLIITFIPRLLTALLVFLLFFTAYRVFGSLLLRVLNRSKRIDPVVRNLSLRIYRAAGLTIIVVMVLAQFGIDVTALLAGLSIVGVAVGFAAKDTLENFISGVTILLDRPFRVGDNIMVDDTFGTVDEITLRSTRIRLMNSTVMVMPNLQMVNQKVINHTMLGMITVSVPFEIGYGDDPEHARQVALKLAADDTRMHPDFPPRAIVTGLAESGVTMKLLLVINEPKLELQVRNEYMEKLREALFNAGVDIPYPHVKVLMDPPAREQLSA